MWTSTLIGLGLIAPPALGQAECRISLQPESAGQAWQRAVSQLRRDFGEVKSEDHDCREIVVSVNRSGGTARFTTRDGRTTTRPVNSPDDLEPTIQALSVTLHDSAAAEAEPSGTSRSSTESQDATPSDDGTEAATSSTPDARRPIAVSLAGGARAQMPGLYTGPVVHGSVMGALKRLELGVTGAWEPSYQARSATVPNGYKRSSMAVLGRGGLLLARQGVTPVAGVYAGLARVSESGNVSAEAESDGQVMMVGEGDGTIRRAAQATTYELRMGPYLGLLIPAMLGTRARLELAADWTPVRFGSSARDEGLPAQPTWSTALTAGVEADLL